MGAALPAAAVESLERTFDFAHRKGALILVTGYQTPDGLRRMGAARLERWVRDRGAYNASDIVTRAMKAATARHTTVIGQDAAALWHGWRKMFSTP